MGAYEDFKKAGVILKDNTSGGEGLALVVDFENSEYLIANFYDSGVMVDLYSVKEVIDILPDTKIKVFKEAWIKQEELTWKNKYYELLEEYRKMQSRYRSLKGIYKQLNRKVKTIKELFNINIRNL